MKIIITTKLPIIILALIASVFIISACSSSKSNELTVMRGKFTDSFTQTGELEAKKALAVPMQRMDYRYGYSFKIVEMMLNGSYVNEGDTLMKLDDAPIQKFIITTEESLEKELAAAEKLRVEYQNAMEDLQAQLKSEQASLNLKKIELERAEYETPQKKKIKQLQFEQAEIRINKLLRQIEIKPKLNEYDTKIQEIKVRQKEAELEGANAALSSMVITSPDKGLFQVGHNRYMYPPVNLKVGDEIRQGQMLAKIPDVTKMIVNTSINEADFTKIDIGTKVRVRLDASPNIPFNGEVIYIARTCISKQNEKEKEKIFKVVVEIDESDLSLKPGMTVSCEFICYEGDNEIYVPNECLEKADGKAYLYFAKGNGYIKKEVKALRSNSNHTLVTGDVKPGQSLVPFENIINQKSI